MKIKELYTDESKWTQDADSRDIAGDDVNGNSQEAVCWCLMGALCKCYTGSDLYTQRDKMRTAVLQLGFHNITDYNDYQHTTFKDVKKLVEILDI